MSGVPFEIHDHTADIMIRARGADLSELFANALAALYTVIGRLVTRPSADCETTLELRAADREELLHDWLSEALFRFEAQRTVLRGPRFEVIEETRLCARVRCEALDPEQSELRREVKAVTYHGLAVEEADGGLACTVIVDI